MTQTAKSLALRAPIVLSARDLIARSDLGRQLPAVADRLVQAKPNGTSSTI